MIRRLALAVVLLVAACAFVPTAAQRRDAAFALAAAHGWTATTLAAGAFDLLAFAPPAFARDDVITVYIEGDGQAWVTRREPSDDPTPRDPLALRLALAQPAGNAAYLARPCQYTGRASRSCERAVWTMRRFSEDVIASSAIAIDTLKRRAGAREVILVGYSGGGTVAALVAARRNDVRRLVTVAGNLDLEAWTRMHHVAPLHGSLDPVAAVDALARVPQHHFVGAKDDVVAAALVAGYAARFPADARPAVSVVPGFDHHCCWAERWPALWREAMADRAR